MTTRTQCKGHAARPSHSPMDFVTHAGGHKENGRGLCGALAGLIVVNEPPTCNACQRIIAKPVYDRNRKKPRPRARRFSGQRRFETRAEIGERVEP